MLNRILCSSGRTTAPARIVLAALPILILRGFLFDRHHRARRIENNVLGIGAEYEFAYLGPSFDAEENGIDVIVLGEIYEYFPSRTEILVTAGIFSAGFLLYTLMLKVAVPIIMGEFNFKKATS